MCQNRLIFGSKALFSRNSLLEYSWNKSWLIRVEHEFLCIVCTKMLVECNRFAEAYTKMQTMNFFHVWLGRIVQNTLNFAVN